MKKIITLCFSVMAAIAIANAASGTSPGKENGVRHNALTPLVSGNTGADMRRPLSTPAARRFTTASSVRKVSRAVQAAPTDLCGSVTYNTQSKRGVQIIPQTPEADFVMIAPDIVANRGAVMVDGIYYVARSEGYLDYTYYIDSYDSDSWELIESRETTIELMSSDMALDPVSGKVYGCFFASLDNISGAESYAFGTVDFNTLEMTPICSLDTKPWSACAFDTDGTLYVIDMEGVLSVVDKNTGETVRTVGSTGLVPYFTSGGIIEPSTGRFFYSFANYYNGSLYEIDKTTGAATLLVDFPNQDNVTGLFFPQAPAESGAPAQAVDVKAEFAGASLQGQVTFGIPSLTYGGAELAGEVGYEVLADKQVLGSGKSSAGSSVNVPVTLGAPGEYEFTVVLSNEAGPSPKVRVKAYVGNDTPLAPVIVSFERSGDNFMLSWQPVVAGIHGGYIDPSAITYRVVRHPDNVTIESATVQTSLSDAVPAPADLTAYSYTVTASAAGFDSEPASTSVIALGEIHPPYFPSFVGENPLMLYTTIDGNEDGQVWSAYRWNETTVSLSLKYNTSKALDDWLITPPIALEAGKSYKISFNTFAGDPYYPERLEVKWGNAPTVEGMTHELLEPTDITVARREPLHVEKYIVPEESGTYFIGFHGISDAYADYLFVQDFEIAAGMSRENVAAQVGSFTVTPDPAGALQAVVSMTAPEKDVEGNPLVSLTKVELYRDLVLVNTFSDPQLGSRLEFTDVVDVKGLHTYRAIPYTEAGAGVASDDISCYLGINVPGKVENLSAVEIDGDGMVTVSWNPPSVDADGNLIVPGIITYTLVDISNPEPITLFENKPETSYTYQAAPAGSKQNLMQWQVTAHTEAGSGIDAKSIFIPVGTPYRTPFKESFYGGNVSSVVYANNIAGRGMWDLYDESYGIMPHDGDNGYAGMTGTQVGDAAALGMGKITIPQTNPGMWLYAYHINTGVENENTLAVEANTGSGWEPVATVAMKDLPVVSAWNRITVKLDKYAGKVAQFRFVATTRTYTNTLIDNVQIGTLHDVDLAAERISVPSKVRAGEPFGVSVTLGNHGALEANGYHVQLFRDGQMVASADGAAIAPGMRASVDFTEQLHVMSPESAEYHAVVVHDNDGDPDNNISSSASVMLDKPALPVVADLQAQRSENTVTLTWGNPDMSGMLPDPVVEGFEEAEPFAVNQVDGWTFVDVDGAPTWLLSGKTFPNQGSEMAYIVFDDTHEFADEYLMAHAGHKYLTCMAAKLVAPEHNDDWLISPELCGASQTISFFAKSYTTQYGYETIEVYYSRGGKEIADFVKVSGDHPIEIPEGWTSYSFTLPDGARYFAIRCTSSDRCAMMIDDITFIPDAELPDIDIVGYNIYRDGTKLNDTPVNGFSYSDNVADNLIHRYGVTVVYDRGESAISNIVDVDTSGVEDVFYAPGSAGDNNVYDLRGIMIIRNATPQQIETLPAGIYIQNGRKLVVK